MNNQKLFQIIKKFAKKLPRFRNGRIDYSNSNVAPVVTIFIKYKDKILLLKRSNKVKTYKNKWNTVSGYLDELKSIRDKVLEEVEEELGIRGSNISAIYFGEPYRFTDNKVVKTWIVYPALVELKNMPKIRLNWENTEYRWIKPEEIKFFDTVPKLEESLRRISVKKIINGILYSVVAIIFNDEGKILMFLRHGEEWERGWEPIKGAIHFGETEEQAVLREIKEEAGLDKIKIIGKLPKFYWAEKPWKNGKLKIKGRVFVCKYLSGKIKLGEPEHISYKWMDVEEAKEKIWLNQGKDIIEDAYKFYLCLVPK